MGAYENPQAVIDTGTPQILAGAIENIGKIGANILDQEKEKRIAEEKARKEWLKYTFEFSMDEYDKAHEQMIANGAANAQGFNLLNPLINNSTSLKLQAAKANTPEEQAAYLKQANDTQAQIRAYLVGEKGKNDAIEEFKKDFGDNPGLAGQEGGIPLAGEEDKKYAYSMAIASGFNKGTQEQYWDLETQDWKIKFTSDAIANDPAIEGDTIVWSKNELAGYDLGKLTDITSKQFKILSPPSEKNTLGAGIIDDKGELSTNYYNPDVKEVKKVKDNGTIIETIVHPWNEAAVRSKLEPLLRAEAIGLLANPSQARKDWENTLGPGKEKLKLGTGSGNNNIFDKASNDAFIAAYIEKGMSKVPRERLADPEKIIPPKPTPPKAPDEADIKRRDIQEDVDRAYKALFVDKIFESDYTDKRGNVAKLKSATISSMGESGFAEQLQKLGLKVKKTEVAGEGDDKVTRYTIESSKIPAFAEQIRSDETLEEVATKLYSATGLNYQGIIDPATKNKFNKLK